MLRDFYASYISGNRIKIDQIDALFRDNWINEGYSSKDHEKRSLEKAKKIVKKYLKENFNKNNLPLALEYPFNFKLKEIKIGGRIDRIDRVEENKIEIIDYKTGENVPSEKDLQDNLQLSFYALAATEVKDNILNKKSKDVLLSLYYLEKDVKITTSRTIEQLEKEKKHILQKAEEISKSDFACSKSIYCKNCEYKMLCSTFS